MASQLWWIGGGSGAGKSTIARHLAGAHGVGVYSCDDAMAAHAGRAATPLLLAFAGMTMDERWLLRSPQEMLDTFHWFAGEAFDLIVDDLAALDCAVIVEGFRLLPHLVAPLLRDRRHAVWLLPTPAFRRRAFEARGTLWSIAGRTSDSPTALDNLLERDRLFTERLRAELADLGLTAIDVDGSLGEETLAATVAASLVLEP